MRIKHHLTTAYSPSAYSMVECLYQGVLRIIRTLLSEWKLLAGQWPTNLEGSQKIIKQSRTKHIRRDATQNMRCPMKIFTGLKPSSLLVRPSPLRRVIELQSVKEEWCNQLFNTGHIHTDLSRMHKSTAEGRPRRRSRAQVIHNDQTHVLSINIDVGTMWR